MSLFAKKYNFINIEKVLIKNFTLYSKDTVVIQIDEDINNGVYCLAGANGLGKTTFLNTINYGLTGLVLQPVKEVFSPSEIIKSNKGYTERYFEGRIKSADKEKAEIEIEFTVNNLFYRIIRGFKDRNEIRLFEIYKFEKENKQLIQDFKNFSFIQLKEQYEYHLTKEIGIGKFEYFIFFQLYVFTFDENRRMLFWDERASTNALSIAFTYDLSDTDRLLELKREMEALESYGRNARWQATQIKNEKEKLLNTKKQKDLIHWDELKNTFDSLYQNVDNSEKIYHQIETEYNTFLKRQNYISSELLQLKNKYKQLFTQHSEPRSKLNNNQYVQYSKKESKCFLCGSSGHYIVENLEKNIHKETCPICNTIVNEKNEKEQIELLNELKKIDEQIEQKNSEIEKLLFESDAKKVELEKSEFNYKTDKELLRKFEKEHSNISFEKTGNAQIDTLIQEYQKQFDKFDQEALDYYKQRDNLKPEYENLLSRVDATYKEAKERFVPLFKKFARSFIGLDLDIYSKRSGKDIILNFTLLGTARTDSFQLSESQRFFLDIALRMSLAVYLSNENNRTTLLIDTPEGSLDIAYESRVGKMFADFVIENNQNIIMTANINASQLLISLAEKCKNKNMKFRRMLEWTDLTEIQKEGEYLFNKVYDNIENALNRTL